VDKGDRVQEGQIIASLNTEAIEIQIRKLEADRQAAIAILDEMRAGPREEILEAARATVRESDAQAEHAKRSLERRQSLINTDSISREDLDQAQTSLKRLEAARTNAQKTLEDLELGTRKEKIATQEAMIDSLQESIAAARVDIQHSSIRSPFTGIIVDRIIHEGVVASPGSPVFVINEDVELEALFGIPPSILDTIEPDKPLTLTVRDSVIQAKLKSIVPQVDDETRTITIVATIAPADCKLVYPGDIAKLELLRSQTSDGFWLKMEVVMQGRRGLWECYVIEPTETQDVGKVVRRAIEILHTEGDRVLVRGALHPDDLIVSNAASRLVVGQLVKMVEREQE
jgi:multidrug efflux pump subunit AcrA (membrane-fusion protein)